MPIILDTTAKSLEVVLVETSQAPEFVVAWADHTATAFIEGSSDGTLTNSGNATTTIVAAPAATTKRVIKSVNIYNPAATAVNIALQINNNGAIRRIEPQSIPPGGNYTYTGDGGSQGPQGSQGPPGTATASPWGLIYLVDNFSSFDFTF